MAVADLKAFSAKFAASDDPWQTYTARDEAVKRDAIIHAVGMHRHGRILELGSGNGSNSVTLARRALRLDAIEGTEEGTQLTANAVKHNHRARAIRQELPAKPPRPQYDCVVVAELLYYLTPQEMARVAFDIERVSRPGTCLVLAHHRIDFHDFAQHAGGIHGRFLANMPRYSLLRTVRHNSRWMVEKAIAH